MMGLPVIWSMFMATRRDGFMRAGVIVMLGFLFLTCSLEALSAQRLAFLRTRPLPFSTKWLLLAPLIGFAFIPAVAIATRGHDSPVAGFTMLGYGWWAISTARWCLSRVSFRPVSRLQLFRSVLAGLAWPLLAAIAPLLSWAAFRAGGMALASAVAMAFGLLGLSLQPEPHDGGAGSVGDRRVSPGAPPRAESRPPARAAGERPVRREQSRPAWLATAARLWLADASLSYILIFTTILTVGPFLIPVAKAPDFMAAFAYLGLFAGMDMGTAASRTKVEFLSALPLTRAQHLAGVVLFRCLQMLVGPAILLLRPGVLVRDALAAALVAIAALFSSGSAGLEKEFGGWLWAPLYLLALGVLVSAHVWGFLEGMYPPLWLMAVEAALAVALWARAWRRVR
jgi:hypothetical protein